MAGGKPGRRVSRPRRNLARRVLVVTEGRLTEPQYVEGLNRYLRGNGTTTVVKTIPVGKDPLNVVRKCIEIRDRAIKDKKSYDVCVCLVDVEQHKTLLAACKTAAKESILMLVSNLKFEVWLRWHIEDKRSSLTTVQLDDLMAKRGLVVKKMLTPTFPFSAVLKACEIARQVDPQLKPGRIGPDPSSAMPILVDLMRDSSET
jgi:hypothetical protein